MDVFDSKQLRDDDGYELKPPPIGIAPHDLAAASTTLDNQRAGEVTDGTISATLRNPLPVGGAVVVVFPSGFKLPEVPTAKLVVTSADGATKVELGDAGAHRP